MKNPLVVQTFGSHYTDTPFVLKKSYQCEQLCSGWFRNSYSNHLSCPACPFYPHRRLPNLACICLWPLKLWLLTLCVFSIWDAVAVHADIICLQASTVASRRDGAITVAEAEELCPSLSGRDSFFSPHRFSVCVWECVFVLWILATRIGLLQKRQH